MRALTSALPDHADPARMVLLGLDEAKQQAADLVWHRGPEPVVCAFYAGGLDLFLNLGHYLEVLVGERFQDDSVTILAPAAEFDRLIASVHG